MLISIEMLVNYAYFLNDSDTSMRIEIFLDNDKQDLGSPTLTKLVSFVNVKNIILVLFFLVLKIHSCL